MLTGTKKIVCAILLKNSLFCLDPAKNMATIGNSCFCLAETFKIFSSENTSPNEMLTGMQKMYVRSF